MSLSGYKTVNYVRAGAGMTILFLVVMLTMLYLFYYDYCIKSAINCSGIYRAMLLNVAEPFFIITFQKGWICNMRVNHDGIDI